MASFDVEEMRPLVSVIGIPAKVRDFRWAYQKKLAVYFILASTFFERIAFYSLVANIVLILNSPDFKWKSTNSATALYIFSGTSYISTVLFAAISDAKLGRAKTIAMGFIPYIIGYIMLILLLHETTKETLCYHSIMANHWIFHEKCAVSISATLICTAIGAGSVQANIAVFGAEQNQESDTTSRYFDKYVAVVNLGGIIAMLVIPYIGREKFYIGSIVAASMLGFAAVLFLIGCRYYIYVDPYDTVITVCIPVAVNACQSWYRYKRDKRSRENEREESDSIDKRSSTFLDYAKLPNQGKFHDRIVNNVKSVSGGLFMFIILVPYWLIYNQLDATFPLQGGQMRTPDGKSVITLMSLGDPITVLIGIFILNMFGYKYFNTEDPVTLLTTKFVIGMSFASITMCIAGVVEGLRQDQCDTSGNSNVSNLHIYYQMPQTIGMGLSELFATVASYEFSYLCAPRAAQSFFMSLRFCSSGLSSLIGTLYINFFPTSDVYIDFSCRTDENWQWSFYTYFFILAAVQLIFILILIGCQSKFQIIKQNPEKMKHHEFV